MARNTVDADTLNRIFRGCLRDKFKKESDVSFIVEGELVFAHREVLVAGSAEFKSLLATTSKKFPTITIRDVSSDIFKTMLLYMHTNQVVISDHTVGQLLYVAHKYKLDCLKAYCLDFIEQRRKHLALMTGSVESQR